MRHTDVTRTKMGSSIAFGGDGGLWVTGTSRSVKRAQSGSDFPLLFRIDAAREEIPPDTPVEEYAVEAVGPQLPRGEGIAMDVTYSSRCVWVATRSRMECVSRSGHLHGAVSFPSPVRQSWIASTVLQGEVTMAMDDLNLSDKCAPLGGEIGAAFVPKQSGYREEVFRSGRVYKGQWYKGQRSGWGLETTPHGMNYAGEWQNDRRYGYGFGEDPVHGDYAGHWDKGVAKDPSGRAVAFTSPTCTTLEPGEVADEAPGPPHPDVQSLYVGGISYDRACDGFMGQVSANAMEGHGTRYFCGGGSYKGEWAEGEPHGQGIYTWPDQTVYEGQFERGHIHGLGALLPPLGLPGLSDSSRPVHGVFKRGMIQHRAGVQGEAMPPTPGRQVCGKLMPGFDAPPTNIASKTGAGKPQRSDEKYEKFLRHRLERGEAPGV